VTPRPPLAAKRVRVRRPGVRPKVRGRRPTAPPKRGAAPPSRARWRWAGLLLAVAIGLAMFLRSCAEEVPPPPPISAGPPAPPLPKEPVTRPPPPPPPKVVKPLDEWAPQRKLLRDAIAARSGDLAACSLPPGSPSRLLTRIRVIKAGAVRGVVFANADPLPRGLPDCLRGKIQAWSFAELKLQADVEVLVTFDLGPHPGAARP